MNHPKSNLLGIKIIVITILLMSCEESTPVTKENIKKYKRALKELKSTDSIKPKELDTSNSKKMKALKEHLKQEQYGEWPIPNAGN